MTDPSDPTAHNMCNCWLVIDTSYLSVTLSGLVKVIVIHFTLLILSTEAETLDTYESPPRLVSKLGMSWLEAHVSKTTAAPLLSIQPSSTTIRL